jgi:hypothetical protein
MEDWRKIALHEVDELVELLFNDDDFTQKDFCDRLIKLLEFTQLNTTADPHEEEPS